MHPMTPVPYRVRSRRPDRADTVTLTLRPLQGDCLPFLPGQFTMLYAPGVGEIPISISGRARSGGYVQTIRAVMPKRLASDMGTSNTEMVQAAPVSLWWRSIWA